MRFATKMDMALFCVYVGCLVVFVLLVLPQAFYLFLNVNSFNGAVAFVFASLGIVWSVNQLRKMVKKE